MGWKINFVTDDPDNPKSVDLDDLPPATFDAIAKEDPTGNWWSVYTFPGESFERMYRVICAAASHAGIDPPDRAETMRDSEHLVQMLERTVDIQDQPMPDGFPQVPDVPESGSSSGAPGDSDGTESSASDSQ